MAPGGRLGHRLPFPADQAIPKQFSGAQPGDNQAIAELILEPLPHSDFRLLGLVEKTGLLGHISSSGMAQVLRSSGAVSEAPACVMAGRRAGRG